MIIRSCSTWCSGPCRSFHRVAGDRWCHPGLLTSRRTYSSRSPCLAFLRSCTQSCPLVGGCLLQPSMRTVSDVCDTFRVPDMAREQAGPGPVLVVPVANVTQHQDTAISGDDMQVATQCLVFEAWHCVCQSRDLVSCEIPVIRGRSLGSSTRRAGLRPISRVVCNTTQKSMIRCTVARCLRSIRSRRYSKGRLADEPAVDWCLLRHVVELGSLRVGGRRAPSGASGFDPPRTRQQRRGTGCRRPLQCAV